ncbi:hypothetical protein TYRP_005854 [Tyrophagus putrescentiae]|nr:hypothetical protein TYRP_005854 [Tyrophagus putrescentiae]
MALKSWPSLWGIGLFAVYFLYRDVQLYKTIQAESRFNITETVKSAMLDHVNSYLLQPINEALVRVTSFPALLPNLSANHVSYLGVVVALISARLALSEHLYIRRISVLVFMVRQFLDDLDGLVARYHLGFDTTKQLTITNTGGYIVDGICDAIGFFAFWLAITVGALHRQTLYSPGGGCGSGSGKTNVLLSSSTYSLLTTTPPPASIFKRRLLKYYALILGSDDPSLKMGGGGGNAHSHDRTPLQEEIFKSSLMFTIMWLWRCLNPHALTIFFLVAVWLNMQTAYARRSSQYVFAIILGVSFLCEMHYQDVNQRFVGGGGGNF